MRALFRRRSRRTSFLVAAVLSAIGLAIILFTWQAGESEASAQGNARDPLPGLTAFRSEAELRAYLQRLRRERARNGRLEASADMVVATPSIAPPASPPPPPAAGLVAGNAPAEQAADSETITNNQTAGVDEGGIVKNWRDYLVMLRRGRLFTVSLAGGQMRPVASINAFPPGVSGQGDWYDEMLVSGNRVIVIGYSYARGGTEINRFHIGDDGSLTFEDAYHLRSNDYYSSRNYASRLIGTRLVYYTPLNLNLYGNGDVMDSLPGVRRWGGNGRGAFQPIVNARRVYVAPTPRGGSEPEITTLHSVITCDLAADTLDCDATGVLGPPSRTFYVSGEAVYLWVAAQRPAGKTNGPSAVLYRMPLDQAERPTAVAARGMPVDQFSFREDPVARRVDVLVRAEGAGDAMWSPERTNGAIALLQLPFNAFGTGSEEAPARFYRDLPRPGGNAYQFQNRFVGDYLLYGTSGAENAVFLANVNGGAGIRLPLPHGVERLEAMGGDALVVGGGSGATLGFTSVELTGGRPRVGDRYSRPEAAQGESRSHGFFYRPDPGSRDGASGILGLPIAKPVGPEYRRFFGSAAAMLYLRRDDRRFSEAGELDALVNGTVDDACVASCMDWYGNARPIFWRGRIFALLGYELVEGRLDGGRITEVGRINYAPTARRVRD